MQANLIRGSRLDLYKALWAPAYESIMGVLGSTGTILPIADPAFGLPNATTFTTHGDVQETFTWSEAWSAFDNHDALADSVTFPYRFQGVIPIIEFNRTDEEADAPDAAYWSGTADGTAPNEPAFSVGAWIKTPVNFAGATQEILSRSDLTTGATKREWDFFIDSSSIYFQMYDDSTSTQIGRYKASGTWASGTTWYFVVGTKTTGVTAAAIAVYRNGVQVDDTNNNVGTYTAMENTAALTRLGFRQGTAAPDRYFGGQMAGGPLGPFFVQRALTVDEIKRLYLVGRHLLGV